VGLARQKLLIPQDALLQILRREEDAREEGGGRRVWEE